MKTIFAAAMMMISTPALAQANDEEAKSIARIAKADNCIATKATELARTSKEDAKTLAELTTYRCFMSHDVPDIQPEHRLAALDTIVKVRSGQ
jgi:hypothetical protein